MYATEQDIVDYTGITLDVLPDNINRIIERAAELIDEATMNRIDTDIHSTVAKKATCAQIEYWLKGVDEQADIQGTVKNYSIGSFSIDFGGDMPTLAPRAKRELWKVGLLNRSVRRV